MQALVTAFEARGFPVTATSDGMRVTILDEAIGFGIEEATKAIEHRTSFTEQRLIDRGLGYQVPKVDHVPAGTLTLVITNVRHVRQRWSDSSKPLEKILNKFLIGLVRAALGLKKQRADAEQRERERQEQERRRQEEARRAAEAALRWREEEGRMQRFDRLASVWRRNEDLRQLVTSIQASREPSPLSQNLGSWLAWAAQHVETSDPLRHLRNRSNRMLTVYYHGWDRDRVRQQGFTEPTSTGDGDDKTKPGIDLTCSPPRESWYGASALKLELPEDVLLPFEWAHESSWYYRTFRVPASVLNRELNIVHEDANKETGATMDEGWDDDD
jgi:hypothetical protein